ncbi:hypothetical protein GNX71_18485 [Variovorax sp. RKNM96]|uniref:hypothetical protein n=1 Tax=Variovorax sp. RKNM96 TaxID=2681552 RepID=UPI00197F8C3A|nr:hypothetical protein [Variovorax sp. RKNM96]QSI31458.1 hypothetical protein GNX71_18485 [Variovorax sp. RKNM96]
MISKDIGAFLTELRGIVNEPIPAEPGQDAWGRGYDNGYEVALKVLKLVMTKHGIAVVADAS